MRGISKGRLTITALVLVCGALALACGGGELQTKDFDAPEADAEIKRGVKPEPDAEAAVLETDFGPIVVELYPNVAPRMVERFKQLAREGFYNGTAFHRAEPYVIQGGDPNSRDDDPRNDGTGSSPYADLPPEFSDLPYQPGIVGAARERAPDTANCQFFITIRPMPQWQGQYTAFGRVIKGLDNARVISGAPTRPGSTTPDPKITIKNVTLQPRQNF